MILNVEPIQDLESFMNEPGFDDTVCKESACRLKTKVGFFFTLLKFLCIKFETCKFVWFSEKTENCPRSNMWSKLVASARICPW